MFETFSKNFERDDDSPGTAGGAWSCAGASDFEELLGRFGGMSFRKGLYRIIRKTDLEEWLRRVLLAFPEFESRITCFGYDWVGTVFAVDSRRLVTGSPGVVMFEPGTGKALNVPSNIQSFHDLGLNEFGEAAFGISFHQRWLASGGTAPAYDQCIGYRKPLFLGGKDVIENLEISDLDVYWHLMSQLIRKTRGLPEGTHIRV